MIVTPREPSGATGVTATANEAGVATIPGLKPGRYAIKAEFSGFEAGELNDVRLRAGDNKQQVELALTEFAETVEVGLRPAIGGRRSQRHARHPADRRRDRGAVGRSQRAMRQLVEMAGGNARVRVDSFNGGSLPSRDVISSIRIVRDTFPAENHSGRERRDRHHDAGRRRRDSRRLFVAPARQRVNGSNPFVE